MATTASYPLIRERNLILASLLTLAAGGWALLVWQAAIADGDMSLTMGLGAPLFIAIWVAMMVAMMFPTAAPMILTFARVHENKRSQGRPFVPELPLERRQELERRRCQDVRCPRPRGGANLDAHGVPGPSVE